MSGRHRISSRSATIALIVALFSFCLLAFLLHRFWPFEPATVIENLEEAGDSRVEIRGFHRTYFPNPGCVLDGVVFHHGSDSSSPLITIDRLTIQGSYSGILAHRLSRIVAQGMRISIPPFGSGQTFHTSRSNLTIGEIVADGTTLEFVSRSQQTPPLRFDIREARLRDVGWGAPLTYQIKLHNPQPPGEITAGGSFGVWDESNAAQTPLSGQYKFEHADLSVFPGIAGLLFSQGKFSGTLGHIDIAGTTDTPDFEVNDSGHPVELITEFKAYVDGTHGDTFLERVDAHFRKTHVVAQGSIAKAAHGEGKTALIDLSADHGRIEDVLGLFIKNDRSPMSGAVSLRAKTEIPPGDRPFLEKVVLNGKFGIANGGFTTPSTQQGVNKLSAGARGEKEAADPETVLTDLAGDVDLRHGVGNFSTLSFGVPGAAARMHGTYNVINHKIDLHGQMRVDSKISKTTTGAKAFLLKMMDPFFKKKKKGEVVPVRISGTYEKPSFGLDLNDKKADIPSKDSEAHRASAPAQR